jgi:hypothetical protein
MLISSGRMIFGNSNGRWSQRSWYYCLVGLISLAGRVMISGGAFVRLSILTSLSF